jgi:hypothetical protein
MRPLGLSLLLVLFAATAGAQPDTSKKAPAAGEDSSTTPQNSVSAGVSAGQLRFAGNAQERAIGATVAAHFWGWADLSVNPTYASATAADTVVGTQTIHGRTSSGFASLPVSVGISHDLAGPWSPSISMDVGFSIPTGDSLSVGGSKAGYGANLDFGLAPSDNLSLGFGASHALSGSYSTGIGNSTATSLSTSATMQVGGVGVCATYSGDVGALPLGYESAQSVGEGLNVPLHGDLALTLDGSAGLTPGAPTWMMSAGLGFTPAGVASVLLSPIAPTRRAFGAGRTLAVSKPRTKSTRTGAGKA